jgi:uncharacterized protein (TIGR02118 family)
MGASEWVPSKNKLKEVDAMIKSFAILKKKDSLSQDEFVRYWKEKHGPLVAKVIPGMKKYIQHHPVRVPGVEYEISGIAELWWDDVESIQKYLKWRQSEEAKVLIEDEKQFIKPGQILRIYTEEQVIVER